MPLSAQEVARLAGLARIELSEDECAELAPELDVILRSVAEVQQADTADVRVTTHAVPRANVFRDDVRRESLSQEQALSGAPAAEEGRFRVPQILSED